MLRMNQVTGIVEKLNKTKSSFVFLGGVHGVGKTTICDRIFTRAGYHCVTASTLIRSYGIHSDYNKRVESVTSNQIALVKQLDFERKKHTHLLLDGHYCLINSNDEIDPVDVEVFCQISPDIFFLLKDCPKKILDRLKNRDSTRWNQQLVKNFQDTEIEHAHNVANQLEIPLHIISNAEVAL